MKSNDFWASIYKCGIIEAYKISWIVDFEITDFSCKWPLKFVSF